MTRQNNRLTIALCIFLSTLFAATAPMAIPPHPDAKIEWIKQGVWEQKVENWQAFKNAGGCAPSEHRIINPKELRQRLASGERVVDTISVITILVDFIDHQWQDQAVAVTPSMFDSILFSNRDIDSVTMPFGSMTDFYLENSFGMFYIKGDIFGWYRMPQTYTYYVEPNDGLNTKVRAMVRGAILMADAEGADFSDYDSDNDGFCDGIIVMHAGAGAETGAYGIWSHAWTISPSLNLDGVVISNYNINPEEYSNGPTTIGVVCHEYGHFLGLPDLYDINYDPPEAVGIGNWSMMAGGSWNNSGIQPAHFDAWCKYDLGFVNVVDVTSNLKNVAIPAVEHDPVIYRLSNGVSLPNEYWFVENRQKYGFDVGLPGSGLLIYHVDYAVYGSNINHERYFVAVEQADGNFDLEFSPSNSGDFGDPFPGSENVREFHDLTTPNTHTNAFNSETGIAVWEITDNDSIIYVDLDIEWSRPYLELSGADSILFEDPLPLGDDDGDLDPGDTILFTASVTNLMLAAYNPILTLSTSSPYITILDNDVPMDGDLMSAVVSNSLNPVKFVVDDSAQAVIDSFTVTITADSLSTTPGSSEFTKSFQFTYAVGTPRVLIVDDDRGNSHDTSFTNVFQHFSTPYKIWNKSTSGSPSGSDLGNYPMVFWHTGEYASNVLTTGDILAMKQFMDGGGNLFLSTTSGISQLDNLDSAFMHNYFKATYDGTITQQNIRGVSGSLLGDNSKYKAPHTAPFADVRQTMAPVESGEAFLSFTSGSPIPSAAISYFGSYKSVLMSFPFEAIQDNVGGTWLPKDTLINRIMFWLFDSPDSTTPRIVQSFFVIGENQNNVINHSPTLGWSASMGYPYDAQNMYQIQIGSDNDWGTAEMWDPGEVASSDTTVVYAGATLVDGTIYFVRVRVKNGTNWSDWYYDTFGMNSPPQAPLLKHPVGGEITPRKPTLFVNNSVDSQGDPLFYIFEVYSDIALTTLVASDSTTPESVDSTGWTVSINLNYETVYWWRSKSSDYFEFSDYSVVETFEVQNTPVAPSAPIALTPADTGGYALFDLMPTFDWTSSTDANPFDTITYKLTIAKDALFLTATNYFNIPSSSYTLTDSLDLAQEYYWRVIAKDNTNLSSPPSNVLIFWTWTPGDVDHSNNVDILDLTYLVDFIFRGGPGVTPAFIGDMNGDCSNVNILDLTYMVDFIFRGGAPPVPGCQ